MFRDYLIHFWRITFFKYTITYGKIPATLIDYPEHRLDGFSDIQIMHLPAK